MLNRNLFLPNFIRMSLCESLPQSDLRELFVDTAEWGELLKDAQMNGTASLLYYTLKTTGMDDLLPHQVMLQLEMTYYSVFARNVSYYKELNEILDCFRRSGMQVVILKGAALGEILYPDMSLRPFNDIDLLIKRQNLFKAENELLRMGYKNTVKERRQGHGREFGDHFTYLKQGTTPLYVELHTHLFPSAYDQRAEVNGLWDRAITAQIGGVSGLILSTEDMVLHLCAHVFGHGFPLRLLWLCDLALIISRHGESLNWKLMEKRAKTLDVHRIVGFVLEQVKQTFDMPLPRGAASWLESCELNRIEKLLFVNESCRVIWYYVLKLRSIRIVRDKLRFIMGRIFPCRDYIMWRYSISDSKFVFIGYYYRFYDFCLRLLEIARTTLTLACKSRPFAKSA